MDNSSSAMNERVGTAQRTYVLDLLSRALEEGYLDLAEYDHRMTIIHSATTADQLTAQAADLPPRFQWDPRQQMAPAFAVDRVGQNARVTSIASLVLAIVSVPLAACFGIGLLFGVGAIILSRPGLHTTTDDGKATSGLVIGSLGIVLSVAMIAFFIFVPRSP